MAKACCSGSLRQHQQTKQNQSLTSTGKDVGQMLKFEFVSLHTKDNYIYSHSLTILKMILCLIIKIVKEKGVKTSQIHSH